MVAPEARSLSFLDEMSKEGREALERMMFTQHFHDGEIVIAQQDLSTSVYLVLRGAARATIFSADGKMVAYRDVPEGHIFGELAAIDGRPRAASIVAVGDLLVGVLSRDQFSDLIAIVPEFTWTLLRHFAVQTRAMTERIFEYSTMLVRERLVHELLRLADATDKRDGAAVISPAPTHYDLAIRISTHREAVSREMSRWSKMGLLVREGHTLSLRDIGKLREVEGLHDVAT